MDFVGLAALLGVPLGIATFVWRIAVERSIPRRIEQFAKAKEAVTGDAEAVRLLSDAQQLLARRIYLDVRHPSSIGLAIAGLTVSFIGVGGWWWVSVGHPEFESIPRVFGRHTDESSLATLAQSAVVLSIGGLVLSALGLIFEFGRRRRYDRELEKLKERAQQVHSFTPPKKPRRRPR